MQELVASDLEFHRLIVVGSGNPVLISLLGSIAGPIQRVRLWRGSTEANALGRTMDEHRAIVRALRSRIPEVVTAAVTTHIFGVEHWLLSAPPDIPRRINPRSARPVVIMTVARGRVVITSRCRRSGVLVSTRTSTTASSTALDADAMRAWDRDGYHVQRGLFSAGEVAAIRERFDRIGDRGEPIPGHWQPRPGDADILARYPRVMHPHDFDAHSKALLLDQRVHRILVQLMDDEVLACQTMYYFKPPGARGQAFHQDNYYLLVQPYTCIAAWLAVDRSWPENGGLMITPGTHRADLECPESADPTQSFTDDYVAPPTEPIGLDLAPGDVLFFTGSVIHGSGPNTTSDTWRRSFISHYLPAKATHIGGWYLPHMYDFDGRPVTRGTTAWGGPCGEDSPKFRGFH